MLGRAAAGRALFGVDARGGAQELPEAVGPHRPGHPGRRQCHSPDTEQATFHPCVKISRSPYRRFFREL